MSFSKKRGVVLIIVLAFVLILAIAAASFMLISNSELRMVRRQSDSTKAFYIAEAGLEVAYKGLEQNWDGYTSDLPRLSAFSGSLETGDFSVDLYPGPDEDTVKVVSKGTVGAAERSVEEIIKGTTGSGLPGFDFAVLAVGNLFLEGSGSIENQDVYVNGNLEVRSPNAVNGGDVYTVGNTTLLDEGSITGNVNANGNITVESGSTITGDATSKAMVNYDGTITGDIIPYASPDPVDEAALQAKAASYRLSSEDWDNYKTQAQQVEGNYHEETFYPSGSYTGIHYVTGSLVINSDISGTATFVVDGNVWFGEGSVDLEPSSGSVYSFIVKGNVESTETSSGALGGVIYTEGNFQVSTAITIEGAVLCYGNFYGSANFGIEFPMTGITLESLSWREI